MDKQELKPCEEKAYCFEVLHTYKSKDEAYLHKYQLSRMNYLTSDVKEMTEEECRSWNQRATPSLDDVLGEVKIPAIVDKFIDDKEWNPDCYKELIEFGVQIINEIKERYGNK